MEVVVIYFKCSLLAKVKIKQWQQWLVPVLDIANANEDALLELGMAWALFWAMRCE